MQPLNTHICIKIHAVKYIAFHFVLAQLKFRRTLGVSATYWRGGRYAAVKMQGLVFFQKHAQLQHGNTAMQQWPNINWLTNSGLGRLWDSNSWSYVHCTLLNLKNLLNGLRYYRFVFILQVALSLFPFCSVKLVIFRNDILEFAMKQVKTLKIFSFNNRNRIHIHTTETFIYLRYSYICTS